MGLHHFFKPRRKGRHDSGVVFHQESEEESYRRYKHLCYRNLIFEALLSLCLGLITAFILGL